MKRIILTLLTCIVSGCLYSADSGYYLSLQEIIEKKAQNVVDHFLGPGNAIVYLQFYLKNNSIVTKYSVKESNTQKNMPSKAATLVPAKPIPGYSMMPLTPKAEVYDQTNESYKQTEQTQIEKEIGKIRLILVVDSDVNKQLLPKVRTILNNLIGMNYARGDEIEIMPVKIRPQKPTFKEHVKGALLSDNGILHIIIILACFAIIVYLSLMAWFLTHRMMKQRFAVLSRARVFQKDSLSMLPPHQIIDTEVSKQNKPEPEVRFDFINEANLEKVLELLIEAPVLKKIMVLKLISPALSGKLFESFPEEIQRDIARNYRSDNTLSEEAKLEFSQELQEILEKSSPEKNFTSKMFEFLLKDQPEPTPTPAPQTPPKFRDPFTDAGIDVNSAMYAFEDIQYLEKKYLKILVKVLSPLDFGIALSSCSPELITRIKLRLPDSQLEKVNVAMDLFKNPSRSKVSEIRKQASIILERLHKEQLIPSKRKLEQKQFAKDYL